MKRILSCIVFALISTVSYADDLGIFKAYVQRADSAFKMRDSVDCFRIEEELIAQFNSNRKKYIKNDEICTIAYNTFTSLAVLDKSKSKKEACELLSDGISLIDDNPLWINSYTNKQLIINHYKNLISNYIDLGDTISAIKYNEEMISFAEKYYKYELSSVLFDACVENSLMKKVDRSYPLYQRLYEMFDDLDRLQQYKVVKNLIYFEADKENYAEVVDLAIKHEKLIAKSKDEDKAAVLDIIGFSFLRYANNFARENQEIDIEIAQEPFELGCTWTLLNYPIFFPLFCHNYANWLYLIDGQIIDALGLYSVFLDEIEQSTDEKLFDGTYRRIEDAEIALTSILVQGIVSSTNPNDLNNILDRYPKVVTGIMNEPNSLFYEDFIKTVERVKDLNDETK